MLSRPLGFVVLVCLVAVVVAGCATTPPKPRTAPAPVVASQKPATPAPEVGPKYVPPAHYRALFERWRKFTYRSTSKLESFDSSIPKRERSTTETDELTCEVREVLSFRNAIVSEIDCTGDERIPGVYAATPDGLIRLSRLPGSESEIAGLKLGELIIGAAPAPGRKVEKLPEGEIERWVHQTREGEWCAGQSDTIGDESTLEFCFGEGLGIVSYTSSWAGGSSREVSVYLVR